MTFKIWDLLYTFIYSISLSIIHNLSVWNFYPAIIKYYFIHILHNIIITICTTYQVYQVLTQPLIVYKLSPILSIITYILHIYHYAFYKITFDEKLHHLINVFIVIPLLWLNYNNICDASLFFMTGLPGGITYLLLFFVKLGYIANIREKYISKYINLWLRGPGCIIMAYIIFINLSGFDSFEKFIAIMAMGGLYWNGIYFTQTIVESHIKNHINNKCVLK